MLDPDALEKLHKAMHNQSILYVEDTRALNSQTTDLFNTLFDTVFTALNAEEGLNLFREHHPSIVIADIKLPEKDVLSMAKTIRTISPETKIIFTSAYEEKALLHEAIQVGASDYLVKPIAMQSLLNVLIRCTKELRAKMHEKLFNTYLQNIFNFQHNMILLLHHETVVMANQPCLDFFQAVSIEEFGHRFLNFGELLLEHSGFLYNHEKVEWLREAKSHPGKLFNVKIADAEGNSHHFVLNLKTIPEKEDYYILSLNDVTELNLLKLFDPSAVEKESVRKDRKVLHGLFEMAKRNSAKIKIHNLYKGLSITNDGVVIEVADEYILIKTTFMQLKAIQFERRIVLVSDIFPIFIQSTDILKIDYDQYLVKLGECKMTETSPTRRQYIRIPPGEEARATLIYQGRKFETDISIADMSVKATRLVIASLPAGFHTGATVILDLVLGAPPHKPFIINTAADVFRISEHTHYYEVVFTYDLQSQHHKYLIDYIAKRQMQLIREFKEKQYE